jgi:hypothetical protein
VVDDETDLCVEGFPRSANAFTVAAIEMAQGRPMRIAHHTHASGHVAEAVRRGIPTIVLVRDPDDAVGELLLARPWLTAPLAFRAYARFSEALLRTPSGFLVIPFELVTRDVASAIDLVNARFGTSLRRRSHAALAPRCFAAMEADWLARVGPGEVFERRVGRPSAWRAAHRPEVDRLARAAAAASSRRRAHEAADRLRGTDPDAASEPRTAVRVRP